MLSKRLIRFSQKCKQKQANQKKNKWDKEQQKERSEHRGSQQGHLGRGGGRNQCNRNPQATQCIRTKHLKLRRTRKQDLGIIESLFPPCLELESKDSVMGAFCLLAQAGMRVEGEVPLWECILGFASTDTRGISLLDSIASCFASIELSVRFKLDALCKRKGP